MNLFFFGADDTWKNLQQTGFYRRNTCLLKAFAGLDSIDRLFAVHRTIRPKLLEKIQKSQKNEDQVQDVFFATIFPDTNVFRRINRWMIWLQVYWQIGKLPQGDDLLFAYWPKGYLAWKAGRLKGKLIFDTDHHLIDDPHLDESQREERRKLLEDIMEHAGCIISSTRSMLSWLGEKGYDPVFRVRNGVDLTRFEKIKRKNNLSNQPPRIGYLGTLSGWINWDLLLLLVERNPACSFRFIGEPYKSSEYGKLMQFPNVYLHGHQSPDEVAHQLQDFDVGLVLYRKHRGLDVDSMKIYEYLAAGIPVVATRFHDYLREDFKGLLYLGDTVEELENCITEALTTGFKKEDTRKEFLQENDWLKRAGEVIQLSEQVW